MKKLCTLAAAAVLWAPQVDAAGFEAKTMRDTFSAREVERGLILGKGWLEFGLGTDIKQAQGAQIRSQRSGLGKYQLDVHHAAFGPAVRCDTT